MGKVIHLDPSLLGHWATVCLRQQPSAVTREAPCPRPQVGMQWKESSGHSEVGAGHQGPAGISPGGGQVCSAGPGPWASQEGVWARNRLLLKADGGLALLVADAEHLPVTSGLSLFFSLFPESGLDPKVTGISFPGDLAEGACSVRACTGHAPVPDSPWCTPASPHHCLGWPSTRPLRFTRFPLAPGGGGRGLFLRRPEATGKAKRCVVSSLQLPVKLNNSTVTVPGTCTGLLAPRTSS